MGDRVRPPPCAISDTGERISITFDMKCLQQFWFIRPKSKVMDFLRNSHTGQRVRARRNVIPGPPG
jgi:hypothetical protein